MRACVRVCVCVCARERACGCTRVLNITHVWCMSVEEAGAGESERECESEMYTYIPFTSVLFYCYFKCTFLSLESMCQRKFFIFMLCLLMNNKDLFDLI